MIEQLIAAIILCTIVVVTFNMQLALLDKRYKAIRIAIQHLENAHFNYKNGNEFNGVDEGEYYGLQAHGETLLELKQAVGIKDQLLEDIVRLNRQKGK